MVGIKNINSRNNSSTWPSILYVLILTTRSASAVGPGTKSAFIALLIEASSSGSRHRA